LSEKDRDEKERKVWGGGEMKRNEEIKPIEKKILKIRRV
jgi:hypothetical protein